MPWKATCPMDDRLRFVGLVLSGDSSMSRLCDEFGISRKTGYKWLDRYHAEGAAGLQERSSAPLRHGRLLDEEIVSAVLALRERWPHWGPRKLRAKLLTERPTLVLPAASTIGEWLHAAGCTQAPARRRRTPVFAGPFASIAAPNDVWCTDFKGWFLTGDGLRCDPLTITDAHSRYLLRCQGIGGQDEEARGRNLSVFSGGSACHARCDRIMACRLRRLVRAACPGCRSGG